MKKTPLLITLSAIGALGAVVFFLSERANRKEKSLWELVPATSLAVLETSDFTTIQKLKLDSSGLIDFLSLEKVRIVNTADPSLCVFQSTGTRTDLVTLVKAADTANFSSWIEQLKQHTKAKVRKRMYEGIDIHDLTRENVPWLSVAKIGKVWITGTHSILVEEVIRRNRSEDKASFRDLNKALFRLSSLRNDGGNLYINWNRFSGFLMPTSPDQKELHYAKWLCHAMLFDLRWSGEALLLNGFATDTTKAKATVLSLFKDQTPVSLDLKSIIPGQYKLLVHFGMSDPSRWFNSRKEFCSIYNPGIQGNLDLLESKYAFQPTEFIKGIDNEIALCLLQQGEEVLVIELKEITKSVSQLNKLQLGLGKEGLHEQEKYANQVIHVLKQPDLIFDLFWPLSFRSTEVFYTILNNHLIFSSSGKGIKKMIDFIDAEDTLSKSLKWRKFFESTLLESNVSFFVNAELQGTFKATGGLLFFFRGMETLQKFSLQFHALEGDYYANSIFEFGNQSAGPRVGIKPAERDFDLVQSISSPPWLVRNQNDRTFEILVQDSANQLQLLSKNGRIHWIRGINGQISDQVEQIDFYKNGKLQYLFVTPGYLHIVDRLGRYLPAFPKKIDMDAPRYMSVVDYDKSKNYRVLVADDLGKIVVCNQQGVALEGWNPKGIGRKLAAAPRHYRIRHRDYFVALTMSGELNLFNRKGEIIRGFPMKLPFKPAPGLFCDGTLLSVVSEDGQLIRVDTRGKIIQEEFLIRNTNEARFQLIPARDESTFIVSRLEQGKLTIFDSGGKQLFSLENPASEHLLMKFIHFNNDKGVILIWDQEQRLFYAVDLTGKILTPQPFEAAQMPAAQLESEGRLMTFFVPDRHKLRLISVAF